MFNRRHCEPIGRGNPEIQLLCRAGIQFFFLLFFSTFVCAETDPKQWLIGLKTFSADYEQRFISSEGHVLQDSRGQLMLLTAPLGLLMEEKWPIALKVVFDGQMLWQYDIALKQITKYRKDRMTDAPLLKLFDHPRWVYWKSGLYDACLTSHECFQLTPPSSSTQFKHLIVGFKSGNLSELHIILPTGEQNMYLFEKTRTNPAIPTHVFQFHPPKGVDVLEEF